MFENECYHKDKCCVDLIICILSTLFAFTVGVIVGALTGILTLLGLGAIIAIAVILAILIIVRIIMIICCKEKCHKDKCY